jgi:hypothetical protein
MLRRESTAICGYNSIVAIVPARRRPCEDFTPASPLARQDYYATSECSRAQGAPGFPVMTQALLNETVLGFTASWVETEELEMQRRFAGSGGELRLHAVRLIDASGLPPRSLRPTTILAPVNSSSGREMALLEASKMLPNLLECQVGPVEQKAANVRCRRIGSARTTKFGSRR